MRLRPFAACPQDVELATLRGASGQEIVDLVKREVATFNAALTPKE